eukprot:TRINITY_DN33109_c0_g1_i1.p1 TRINITY_DN33109_c0_g1~~TRINITY_DN33109_c0_g1_i1.p1  ORF type:complete len:1466 (-),score=226.00 TRINITY_DN33109_c0_g1_i1:57-4454(-)
MADSWAVGSPCWVPHERRAFAPARVVKATATSVLVSIESGDAEDDGVADGNATPLSFAHGQLLPRSRDKGCVPEMDALAELNEAEVLANIAGLYARRCIYSSVGPVLVAMNPFTSLDSLYGPAMIASYRGEAPAIGGTLVGGPHCYRIVESAYRSLRGASQQSVVICGESGAGKTVTSQKMLDYLCVPRDQSSTSPPASGTSRPSLGASLGSVSGVQRITEASVLLESFGNARTVRNNNSSRFGRYTKIMFDSEKYEVCGCAINHYLLERTRVAFQPEGERNYHIFHQVFHAGSFPNLGLEAGEEAFAYTRSGASLPAAGFDSAEDYRDLHSRLEDVGFTAEVKAFLHTTVAAILHVGNITFRATTDGTAEVDPKSASHLRAAVRLLALQGKSVEDGEKDSSAAYDEDSAAARFSTALSERFISQPVGPPIRRGLDVASALSQRDAVAKMLYSRLFDWLVSNLNQRLAWRRQRPSVLASAAADAEAAESSIGLLDIFGFEDMPTNGFEQQYINLTNERIQHLFGKFMFQEEVAAYRKDGLEDTFDHVHDNWDCVTLFTSMRNPFGIVRQLADLTVQKGTEEDGDREAAKVVSVLNRTFRDHPNFTVCTPQNVREFTKTAASSTGVASRNKPKGPDYRECFAIEHYVGTVMYVAHDFLQKSRDSLRPHLVDVLRSSGQPLVASLLSVGVSGSTVSQASRRGSIRETTVGEKFCSELEALAGRLEQGKCSFVRCIKPNKKNMPLHVDRPMVLEQLKCGGVIAALEIRNAGFPERQEFHLFLREFSILGSRETVQWQARERCEQFLSPLRKLRGRYAFGNTKVFMKDGVLAYLRSLIGICETHAANLVRWHWRRHKGTTLILCIEDACARRAKVQDAVGREGVDRFTRLRQVLADTDRVLGAAQRDLRSAQEKYHGDVGAVGQALSHVRTADMRAQAESAERALTAAIARKAEIEAALALQIERARQRSTDLLARVDKLEEMCASATPSRESGSAIPPEPAELVACREACERGRARLEKFVRMDLPAIQSRGIEGILEEFGDDDKLIGTAIRGSVGPQSLMLLAACEATVAEADVLFEKLNASRSGFEKASAAVRASYAEARGRLEALQQEAQKCIGQGIDESLGASLEAAWSRDQVVQELLRTLPDISVLEAAVTAFVQAEAVANEEVKRAWGVRKSSAWQLKNAAILASTDFDDAASPSRERESASSRAAVLSFSLIEGDELCGLLRLRVLAVHGLHLPSSLRRRWFFGIKKSTRDANYYARAMLGHQARRTEIVHSRTDPAWDPHHELPFRFAALDGKLDLTVYAVGHGGRDDEIGAIEPASIDTLTPGEWHTVRAPLRGNGALVGEIEYEVRVDMDVQGPSARPSVIGAVAAAAAVEEEESAAEAWRRRAESVEKALTDLLEEVSTAGSFPACTSFECQDRSIQAADRLVDLAARIQAQVQLRRHSGELSQTPRSSRSGYPSFG